MFHAALQLGNVRAALWVAALAGFFQPTPPPAAAQAATLPGGPVRTIPLTYPAEVMALSPDGRMLAVAGRRVLPDTYGEQQAELGLWDVRTGRLLHRLWVARPRMEGGPVVMEAHALAFTPDGHRLVVAGRHLGAGISSVGGGEVDTWDVRTGQRVRTLLTGGQRGLLSLTPDARFALCGDVPVANYQQGKPTFRVWDVVAGRLSRSLTTDTDFVTTAYAQRDTLAVSPDGGALAYSTGSGVELWDVKTGARRARLPEALTADVSLVFSADGGTLLTWGHGLQLWDARTGGLRLSLIPRDTSSVTAAVSPNGGSVACLLTGGTVEVFRTGTGALTQMLSLDRGGSALAFSAGGKALAAGGSVQHFGPHGPPALPATGFMSLVAVGGAR